jgi:hypothetical protein
MTHCERSFALFLDNAYVYFQDDPGRRSASKLLSNDEVRRVAVNVAKLPARIARAVSRHFYFDDEPQRRSATKRPLLAICFWTGRPTYTDTCIPHPHKPYRCYSGWRK